MRRTLSRIVAPSAIALLVVFCVFPVRAQDQSSATNSATNSTDQKKQTASIAGAVVRAGTDEPLRKAQVHLTLKDDQGWKNFDVVTAADGKFVFEGLAPGTYRLSVSHDGYVTKSYGPEGEQEATLTLAAGQKMEVLIFRLQKCAVITGRVVDEDGDPVPGADVVAVQRNRIEEKSGRFHPATPQRMILANTGCSTCFQAVTLSARRRRSRRNPKRAHRMRLEDPRRNPRTVMP
jgi:hypothetical protein